MKLVTLTIQSHYDGFDVTLPCTDEQLELLETLSEVCSDWNFGVHGSDTHIGIVHVEEELNAQPSSSPGEGDSGA